MCREIRSVSAGFKTGANPLLCDAGSQSIGWNGPDCRVQ